MPLPEASAKCITPSRAVEELNQVECCTAHTSAPLFQPNSSAEANLSLQYHTKAGIHTLYFSFPDSVFHYTMSNHRASQPKWNSAKGIRLTYIQRFLFESVKGGLTEQVPVPRVLGIKYCDILAVLERIFKTLGKH